MNATKNALIEKVNTALTTRLAQLNASALNTSMDIRQYERTSETVGHVLAIRNAGTDNAEYVTWAWGLYKDDGTAGLFWGHYFDIHQYDDAIKDYGERAAAEDTIQ